MYPVVVDEQRLNVQSSSTGLLKKRKKAKLDAASAKLEAGATAATSAAKDVIEPPEAPVVASTIAAAVGNVAAASA